MSYPASWHFQLTQQSFQGYTPMLTSQANIYLYIAARYAIFLEMDEILRDTYEGYPQGDSIHPSKRKRIGDFVITHKHYTVAWICALHIEMAAARFMLDEENPPLSTSADDSNTYVLGSISQLNVVIACLPTDHYGTNNASNVMTNMKRTFPEIKFSLMVGIGGGVPGKFDIRLGDVIVGTRVMQYDLGKIVRHGNFQGTAVPRVLHPSLGTAVSSLRSKHELESSRVVSILLHRVEGHSKYGRPTSMDRLFCATYIHESPTDSCDRCDPSKLIPRSQRDLDVVIHYGAIASGNQVMKSAVSRDSLARQLDVICFEMEAAGLTDIVPCLPIRGICDYSDSHKNKEWQRYAAATAAAYAREFLQELPTARSHSRVKWAHDDTDLEVVRRQRLLDSLKFEQIDSRKLTIKIALTRTCGWLLAHPSYNIWLDPVKLKQHHGFLWISGKPGAGKSTIMKFAYSNLSCKGVSEGCVTASFFFNARGEYLERSISGMYRSLLLQLLQGYPNLQKVFDDIDLIPHSQTGCPSLNILKELFRSAVLSLGQSHFTCFIDALDECDEQEVVDMVQSFEELAEQATAKKIPLRICFSSRHYPYIVVKQGIRLTLEDQSGHAEDLATYAASRLQIEDPALIDELKPQILKKSAGVFIWVVFVIEILNKEYRRGGLALRKRLAEIPSDLGELFKDILRRDNENMEALQLCIFHILYAKRPLQPKEFYHALWSGLALENLVDEQIPDVTVSDTGAGPDRYTRYVISSSKGLAEITRSKQPTVQFIHESVRDFLIKDKGLYELWPELGFDCESYGHEKLKHCCNHYINHALGHPDVFPNEELSDSLHDRVEKMPGTKYPFLKYATHHILYHADIAAKQVAQDKFLSHFPTYDWIRLNNSFERLEIHEYSPTTRLISVLADKGFSELLRIRILADNGADVNASSNYGYTPLLFASANGHEAVARLLIENGADVNTRDITRCTPLFNASRNGHEAVVMLLIDNDADVNVYDNIGYTPLMYASIHGHTAVVRLLIDNGADAQATDKFGYAPLMYASRNGHEATARLLIDKGAAVNVNDSMGNTPLIFASMNGHDAVVRLLVKRGAAVNVNDSMGNTPLIFASMNGRETVVRLLLDNGANVHAHNLDKCTSLSYAKKNYHGNVEKLLIQMGAESTGASGSGRGKATSGS